MIHQKNLESIVHELGNSGQFRKFISYCIAASDNKHMGSSLAQATEEAIAKKEEVHLLEALERSLEISVSKYYKSFHQNRQAYLWQKYKALLKIIGMVFILIAICIGIGWVLNRYEKLPFKKYAYHYVLSDTLYLRDQGINNAIIDTLFYGERILVNAIDETNSIASVETDSDSFWGGTEGSVHSFYVVDENQFQLYSAMLGSGEQDNDNLKTPWIRKALLDYFESKKYLGIHSSKKALKQVSKENEEVQQWGFSGLQSPGNVHDFFRIDEQLNPKQRYVTRRYYALLNFGEERSLNADLSRKISRFTALVLYNTNGGQRFVIFEFNAAQEVVQTYAYDLPQTGDNSRYVLKEIFRGFDEVPEMTPYVAQHAGIICRSKNPEISETILFYYDTEKGNFGSTPLVIPAKPF